MSFRTITTPCRNMSRSLNEVKSNFFESTKRLTTNASVKEVQSNSDGEEADQYGSDNENSSQSTVFKRIFKQYKKRRPPPDLSAVIDPATSVNDATFHRRLLDTSHLNLSPSLIESLGLRSLSEWNVATIAGREGLFVLPGLIRKEHHMKWIKRVENYVNPPTRTNMTIHGTNPERDVLRTAGPRLRWATLGIEYDWNTKEYPESGRQIPSELVELSKIVSEALGLGTTAADAAIINIYPSKTTLSPHVDKSERSSAPLVSFSLGQPAVYLSGGLSLDDPVIPIWLRSGDVLVMFGSQRLVYHGVPRIETGTVPFEDEDKFLADFATNNRVNITIRQVNSGADF